MSGFKKPNYVPSSEKKQAVKISLSYLSLLIDTASL